jgi:hypothetical protein
VFGKSGRSTIANLSITKDSAEPKLGTVTERKTSHVYKHSFSFNDCYNSDNI